MGKAKRKTVSEFEELGLNSSALVKLKEFTGEDRRETREVLELGTRVSRYLLTMPWCQSVEDIYVAFATSYIILIALVKVTESTGIQKWLWTVVGDLPSAHFDLNDLKNSREVFNKYISELENWIYHVNNGLPVTNCIYVNVEPTTEWATNLQKRVSFLKENFET